MPDKFRENYNKAAAELLSVIDYKIGLHAISLRDRFTAALGLSRHYSNNRMVRFSPPEGVLMTAKAYDNTASLFSWIYLLGICQSVDALKKGETPESLAAKVTNRRNPLTALAGQLPEPPENLRDAIMRSPEAANDGHRALYDDALSLVRMAKLCRDGENTSQAFYDWAERLIAQRIEGKTFEQILPLRLEDDLRPKPANAPASAPTLKP